MYVQAAVIRGARLLALAVAFVALAGPWSEAQQAGAQDDVAAAPVGSGDPLQLKLRPRGPLRRLAPGVLTSIDPERQKAESVSRHDVVEILAVDPAFAVRPWTKGRSMAKDVVFSHDIWALDFSFKPLRQIEVDVPDLETGRMVRKLIWYLVFSVRNSGKVLKRTVVSDDPTEVTAEVVESDEPVRFIPNFVLMSWETGKQYPDRLIPVAIPQIERREDPNLPLLSTVEMAGDIPVSTEEEDHTLWGVATWEDLDPRIDFLSIYVSGLTNAYRWEDARSDGGYAYKQGDPLGTGRTIYRKTLQLNFWRPGDDKYEHDREIRFGYFDRPFDFSRFKYRPTAEDKVDYRWVYR
ncbi:MAG: hypothetical protein K6T86_12350 [Pirellulales bacterium]|nr:hypothetical protein [Pirellulales bacterium]